MEEATYPGIKERSVELEWVRLHPLASVPTYQSAGAAGADVCACVSQALVIEPQSTVLVPCGFAVAVPEGFELQIRPRSGLALKNGIHVSNSPGTIDSDYRGEIKVILFNSSSKSFTIEPGMRIAQAVLSPVYRAIFVDKYVLSVTERGRGGFGSTGL